MPELVSPLAPIVLLELELVSVDAVLLLDGVDVDDEADVSVLGVLGDVAAVEPLLLEGVVVLLPGVAAVLPEPVEPELPVLAPAPVAEPVEPEVVPAVPEVCAMEMPPMTSAAAAATVVRVFLMVIML